jgi:hypothetical protein
VISNYTELKAAVQDWAVRQDSSFVGRTGDMVALAEAWMNRKLRTRWQEAALTSEAIVAYQLPIPARAVAVKRLWPDSDAGARIEQSLLEEVVARRQSSAGVPMRMAWAGTNWEFDATGVISGVYFLKVPALSDDAPTNWVLSEAPDLYLFAALEQAAIYQQNANAAKAFQDKAMAIAAELNSDSQAAQVSGGKLIRR